MRVLSGDVTFTVPLAVAQPGWVTEACGVGIVAGAPTVLFLEAEQGRLSVMVIA